MGVSACESGERNANLCRQTSEPAPQVAFCISGVARSFSTPLVLEAFRRHLFDALAGPNTHHRLFVQLKVGLTLM